MRDRVIGVRKLIRKELREGKLFQKKKEKLKYQTV